MNCPICNNSKTICVTNTTQNLKLYRHRRCGECKHNFKTVEMLVVDAELISGSVMKIQKSKYRI